MRKMREDSTWNGLTAEQRQKLENWLFERNLGYAEALERAHKEFGVQSLFGNYEGHCGEGFWLWPRRSGRAQRLLRRACHPAFSPKTAPLVVSKQARRAVEW